MTNSHANNSENLKKLRDLIKDIDYAMLTTVNEDGTLHSRPMATNREVEFDGDVWFFTYASSYKVVEINRNHQVNVSYAAPNKQCYVSLSGTAELVRDRQKLEEMWQPQLKAWFPKGLDEPDIALLKVNVEKAEYWDSPSSIVANTISLVKGAMTGKPADVSKHEKLELK
ncbi:pyridoxamine 5'-phosphate oxidase family protein [Chlorogloeopsis sp. ULAP01]|jgi:general stress protein 26|uniref:pyridoxamine 5'-phosphate oxidase family protein n=1 Tax=Chlorogloeopsis TaxID=1123 RepID=UPI0019F68EA0|nr:MULTISPECIES: pyridoxamine 5'-phosphate oxidase family protein [Chlorogloeopsis]MBF2008464.1 pyridoxamine 5'-phosphate oxidase family protein [Chlorogloeopsis fritschii C42_A2020_084]MDM9385072.1 pyridoxamine 5'-phosphate oxidase family protein [Chlorogloeopsis sp. ULAP01]